MKGVLASATLAAALLLGAGAAGAQTEVKLVGNTGQADLGGTASFANDHAMLFVTGTHTRGYTLTRIDLEMRNTAQTSPTYTVSIHQNTGTGLNIRPSASVGTLTRQGNVPNSFGLVQFTNPDGIDLDAGTSYWVVFDVTGNANSATEARKTSANAEDPNASAGWTLGDGHLWREAAATTWILHGADTPQMAIYGKKKPQIGTIAAAGSLISNLGRTDAGAASFENDLAQPFTTGSNVPGYGLANVWFTMKKASGTPPSFNVHIYSRSSSGHPGKRVGRLEQQGDVPATFGNVRFRAVSTFGITGIHLEPSTTYFVVVDVTANASNTITLKRTSDKGENTGGTTGWSIGNARRWRTATSDSWSSESANVLQLSLEGGAKTVGPALSSAAVTDKTLTLTFAGILDQDSVPAPAQFTVKVANRPVAVTDVAMSANKAVTLTLAEAAGRGQAVTVSYRPNPYPIRDLLRQVTLSFTDETVTNTSTNRAPVFTGTKVTAPVNAPTGSLISNLEVPRSDFNDPDGDTLTFSLSANPDNVFESGSGVITPAHPTIDQRVYVWIADTCHLENLQPAPPNPLETIVTVTATDPTGAAAHVDRLFRTRYKQEDDITPNCPTFSAATVTDKTLTLTFHQALTGWTPTAAEFEVKVEETVVALADTNPVSVDGATVTLTLADAVGAGQTVTLSHTPGDDPHTVGFTDETVTNSSTNHAPRATREVRTLVLNPPLPPMHDTTETEITEPLALNAKPGVRAFVEFTFSDADAGDTLTITSEADRTDVFTDNPGYFAPLNRFYVQALPVCELANLELPPPTEVPPPLPRPPSLPPPIGDPAPPASSASVETTVTVTATDPTGAAARVTIVVTTAWDPADCPELESAVVNGATLALVYNQALDEEQEPLERHFAVTVDGTAAPLASPGAVVGNRVLLTLAEPVAAGARRVTVSYTAPAFGGIKSAAFDPAASFTNEPVTVVSTDITGPALRGATVEGATLTLTYNELLDPAFEPDPAQFPVRVKRVGPGRDPRGVTDVEIDGGSVVLTLASAVGTNRQVWVGYNRGAGAEIQDYAGNLAPPFSEQPVTHGPPPAVVQRALVNGATLTLTWSQNLDAASVPAQSAFTVKVGGTAVSLADSNAVAVAGRTVTLTLARAVARGAVVTVSYVPPTGGGAQPLRDTASTLALDLSDEPVLNVTGDRTGPRLQSATVEGATLTLVFDEPLDPASEPNMGGFRVAVITGDPASGTSRRHHVTAVEVVASRIVLTLDEAVTEEQLVTLTYSQTSESATIQDYAGNAMSGIIQEQPVTHGPPPPPAPPPASRPPASRPPASRPPAPPPVGLSLSGTEFELYETGDPGTFTVTLATAPPGAVTVDVASADPTRVTAAPAQLVFTPDDWDAPQTVTLTALADADDVDREPVTVQLTPRGEAGPDAPVQVTVTHREVPPVEVLLNWALTRVQEGLQLALTVNLSAAPRRTVTVPLVATPGTATPDDYAVAPLSVTFGPAETTRTVIVSALDDDVADEPDETVRLAVGSALPARVTAGAQVEAEVTIEDRTRRTAAVQAWTARFGRTAATHVTDAVGDRLRAPPAQASHLTLGGYRLPLGRTQSGAATAGRSPGGREPGTDSIRGPGEGDQSAATEPDTATTVLTEVAQVLGMGPGAGAEPTTESPWLNGRPDPRLGQGRTLELGQTFTLRRVLLGSSFRLALGGDEADSSHPRLTAWGRFAGTTFAGQDGDIAVDGDVFTGTVGVDSAWDRWLAGVAVAHSLGDGSYTMPLAAGGREEGALEQTLTSLHPYVRYAVTDRLDVWGLVGYGWGELDVELDDGDTMEMDTNLMMGALGGRGIVLAPEDTGGFQLATRTDAMLTRTSTAAGPGVDATDADAHRVRLILEGSRGYTWEDGQRLTPTVELGLRHDWGDAETGFGLEVGSRVSYAHPGLGLTVEGTVRGLLAHEDTEYDEWGASGTVRVAPGAGGQGLSLTLAPAWGATASGVEGLWSRQTTQGLAPHGSRPTQTGRVTAEVGYGLALFDTGLLTPYTGTVLADGADRTYRLGARWAGGTGWQVHLEGTRQEPSGRQPVNQGVQVQATWGF